MNPGIATNYHLLLAFLHPVVARYNLELVVPGQLLPSGNGVSDQAEACRLPRSSLVGYVNR
jgi:hypothetical protein